MMKHLIRLLLISLFMLLAVSAHAQDDAILLPVGEPLTGEITEEQPEVRYTFEGVSGEEVTIRMTGLAPLAENLRLDSYLTLLDPSGNVIETDDDGAGALNAFVGPTRLYADGTHTIVAGACCNVGRGGGGGGGGAPTTTGAFEIELQKVETSFVSLGEAFTVELNSQNPVHGFYFGSEDASDNFFVRVSARILEGEGSIYAEGRGPIGREYFGRVFDAFGRESVIEPVPMDITGAYFFRVGSRVFYPVSGDVSEPVITDATVEVIVEPINAQAVSVGDNLSGALDDSKPVDYYTFEATAGSLLQLNGSSDPALTPTEFLVVGPNSQIIGSGSTAYRDPENRTFNLDPMTVTEAGQHLVIVRRITETNDGLAGTTASYEVTVSDSSTPVLALGVPVSDAVDGDQNVQRIYRYNGSAGETITITLSSNDDTYAPEINIQSPAEFEFQGSGSLLNFFGSEPGSFSYTVTLPRDGLYLFRISNGNYGDNGPTSGAFTLTISQ
jgi:hypothetical protein